MQTSGTQLFLFPSMTNAALNTQYVTIEYVDGSVAAILIISFLFI